MVAATLFTQTTRFRYNGLGARVAVEVVGYGTTTVTLDYAASNRILAEETLTGTTQYLYPATTLRINSGQAGKTAWTSCATISSCVQRHAGVAGALPQQLLT